MKKRKQENPKNHRLNAKGKRSGNRFRSKPGESTASLWIYGIHAVQAALNNPAREIERLLLTKNAASILKNIRKNIIPEEILPQDLGKILPDGAVHQGAALLSPPLPEMALEDLHPFSEEDVVVILDQVNDPHNVGAILRSAAAFGAKALILQSRHSPALSGVLAKAASGALEHIPVIRVTNIARTLEELDNLGVTSLGLAEEGTMTISDYEATGPTALVLGAEGPGLRRLTREHCTHLVSLPTLDLQSSLNVSNAAAVSLYALHLGKAKT